MPSSTLPLKHPRYFYITILLTKSLLKFFFIFVTLPITWSKHPLYSLFVLTLQKLRFSMTIKHSNFFIMNSSLHTPFYPRRIISNIPRVTNPFFSPICISNYFAHKIIPQTTVPGLHNLRLSIVFLKHRNTILKLAVVLPRSHSSHQIEFPLTPNINSPLNILTMFLNNPIIILFISNILIFSSIEEGSIVHHPSFFPLYHKFRRCIEQRIHDYLIPPWTNYLFNEQPVINSKIILVVYMLKQLHMTILVQRCT